MIPEPKICLRTYMATRMIILESRIMGRIQISLGTSMVLALAIANDVYTKDAIHEHLIVLNVYVNAPV